MRRFALKHVCWMLPMALSSAMILGCQATKPDDSIPPGQITVDIDVIPILVPADSSERATVWITVKEGGAPIADSTIVNLVATLGSIPPEAFTNNAGLATTKYTPPCKAGVASIIAQARGVRDTMHVTLYER